MLQGKTRKSKTDMERAVRAVYHRDGGVSMTVPGIKMGYIDRFLNWNTAPELLALGIYTAREITESIAMRQAAIRKMKIDPKDPDVIAVVVGDGATPRTGAILAYTTKWTVNSVDPQMKHKPAYNDIDRLSVFDQRIDDFCDHMDCFARNIVILAPHTHCELKNTVDWALARTNNVHLAVNPCCHDLALPEEYGAPFDYDDWNIVSGHRRVQVWRNITRS